MDHEPLLISTIAIGLSAAFVGGLVARRLRLPPIVGYLLAGVAVGPYTPGLIADTAVAQELAEIGVVLLMFGVGIHFSIRDLVAVRSIAVPGAIGQIAVATALGLALGLALGWSFGGALVLGLALSVASTVVLLRALMERNELNSVQGRIAVGWLIVEDLFTVAVLVLLPAVAPLLGGAEASAPSAGGPLIEVAIAVGKAALFAVAMILVGARLVPRLLMVVAQEGSRELFTLGVLTIALGLAFASSVVFGVSLALGAFLAGAIVSESDLSHQAAADAIPLRDAFAVLFFVSVGMLVDPAFLAGHPLEIAAVVGLIVVAKSLAAFLIVMVLGYPTRIGLTVAAALAQIGEFSFILASLGGVLGILPPDGFQLIVAASLISITLNPVLFFTIEPLDRRLRDLRLTRALAARRGRDLRLLGRDDGGEALGQHTIICGFGRVGRMIAATIERRGFRYVVITTDRRVVEDLRREGKRALYGDASTLELLREARVDRAKLLIAAVNDPHATRLIIERARGMNPRLDVVARTHSAREAAHLRAVRPLVQPVFGEQELAVQMLRYALRRYGVGAPEIELIAQGVRRRGGPPSGPPASRRPLLSITSLASATQAFFRRLRARLRWSSRPRIRGRDKATTAMQGPTPHADGGPRHQRIREPPRTFSRRSLMADARKRLMPVAAGAVLLAAGSVLWLAVTANGIAASLVLTDVALPPLIGLAVGVAISQIVLSVFLPGATPHDEQWARRLIVICTIAAIWLATPVATVHLWNLHRLESHPVDPLAEGVALLMAASLLVWLATLGATKALAARRRRLG